MQKRFLSALVLILVGVSLLSLAACGPTETTEAPVVDQPVDTPKDTDVPAPAVPELFGDSIRGGLLYDKWWTPLGLDKPEDDHPLWASQDTNTRSGADTWRCKECHGWDYKGADGAYGSGSHFTGFVGVLQFAGGDANEVLAALKGETNADHDFSTIMDEQALTDLALFITSEAIDYGVAMVAADKSSQSSDIATGETLFSDTCAECHGPEGLAINFKSNVSSPEYIGGLSGGNPWEFLHKARFGQPGVSDMPSAIDNGWSEDEQAALLAYAQSLPNSNLATQGGQLYDKWWKALGIDEPAGDMPLWATQSDNTREGADTWRCKECHGWDYKGAEGAYASGSHYTGFTGILAASSLTSEEIIAWMDGSNNADHDFSPYLDDAAMQMFVAFIQGGMVDMADYINDDKSINGDASLGKALFEQGCSRCHGEDGNSINFGSDDDPEYLGGLANGNPWESFHKAANGQPGTHMTSGFNMGWSVQDIFNLLAYVQTLVE